MLIGSVEWKVFKAWCVGNPTGTISDWRAFWDALKDLVEVRGK